MKQINPFSEEGAKVLAQDQVKTNSFVRTTCLAIGLFMLGFLIRQWAKENYEPDRGPVYIRHYIN